MDVTRAIALLVLGFAVATGTFLLLQRRDRVEQRGAVTPEGVREVDDGRLDRLEQELALLRSSVEDLTAAFRDARMQSPPSQRVPAEGGAPATDRILDELGAMEARLTNQLRNAQTDPSDAATVDALLGRIKAPDAFPDRKEVKLLTAEQVLERFGAPTDVWSNTNGITWQYARDWDHVREKYELEIILRIPDGYVTQLAVR
jgi:hypothetical protein